MTDKAFKAIENYIGAARSVGHTASAYECHCGDTHLLLHEHLEALLDRVEKVEQALQRVRELHSRSVSNIGDASNGYWEEEYCLHCQSVGWPCDTIRALEGDDA